MKTRLILVGILALVILGTGFLAVRDSRNLPKEEPRTAAATTHKSAKKGVEQPKRITLSVALDPQFVP